MPYQFVWQICCMSVPITTIKYVLNGRKRDKTLLFGVCEFLVSQFLISLSIQLNRRPKLVIGAHARFQLFRQTLKTIHS